MPLPYYHPNRPPFLAECGKKEKRKGRDDMHLHRARQDSTGQFTEGSLLKISLGMRACHPLFQYLYTYLQAFQRKFEFIFNSFEDNRITFFT